MFDQTSPKDPKSQDTNPSQAKGSAPSSLSAQEPSSAPQASQGTFPKASEPAPVQPSNLAPTTPVKEQAPKQEQDAAQSGEAISAFEDASKFGQVEDIFAGVEKPAPAKPKEPSAEPGKPKPKKESNKLPLIISAVVLAAVIGYAWYAIAPKDQMAKQDQNGFGLDMLKTAGEDAEEQAQEDRAEVIEEEEIDPALVDSDQDGLTDFEEAELGTNADLIDSDGDQVLDYDEVFVYDSNPLNPDSDEDELNDYDEVYLYKTNPLSLDTDADNLSDNDEINVYKTDPLNQDTDGDTYPDGVEIAGGYNPLGEGKLIVEKIAPPEVKQQKK